jgi:hypothetical protein
LSECRVAYWSFVLPTFPQKLNSKSTISQFRPKIPMTNTPTESRSLHLRLDSTHPSMP